MKVCSKFFEHLYINPRGDVRICGWNNLVLGNLLQESVQEIWDGENRKKLLEALLDGERFECREGECPECLNNNFMDLTNEEIKDLWEKGKEPICFNSAYDYRCNHICPSCRHELYVPSEEYIKNMEIITDKLSKVFPKAKRISLNGSGDLFANPETLKMLENFKPVNPEISINIETNGTLLKKNWHRISHLAKYIKGFTVTVNSYDRRTYQHIQGADNLPACLEGLELIKELKKENPDIFFSITMVVQDSNFRQIPEFIDTSLNKYHADRVILRPIFMWFQISKEDWWYKNVQNPAHIYHQEFLDIMKEPICSDPRVFEWGTQDEIEPVTLQDILQEQQKQN